MPPRNSSALLKMYSASAKRSDVLSSAFSFLIDFLGGHRLTSTCIAELEFSVESFHPRKFFKDQMRRLPATSLAKLRLLKTVGYFTVSPKCYINIYQKYTVVKEFLIYLKLYLI
jgi:hypothetical protein